MTGKEFIHGYCNAVLFFFLVDFFSTLSVGMLRTGISGCLLLEGGRK